MNQSDPVTASFPAFHFDFLEKRQFQEAEMLVNLRRQLRELQMSLGACSSLHQRRIKECRMMRLHRSIERHTARLASCRRQRSVQRRQLVA